MGKICRRIPEKGKGQKLFIEAKEMFGRKTANTIVSLCEIPRFIETKNFRTDEEGYPLLEDILKDKDFQSYIEDSARIYSMEKQFETMDDNRENYTNLVYRADAFNQNPENKGFIAIVKRENDKLVVKIDRRNLDNEQIATDQIATIRLNRELSIILSPIGITEQNITDAEEKAGRVGVTDFSKAKNIAEDSISVIRLADNREGVHALSEEFSHLMIGAYHDDPLVQRALALLNDEGTLKEILGDEFDKVRDFQEGDNSLIAEEALGKLLRENLISAVSTNPERMNYLLNRLYDKIRNKFSRINANRIIKAINEANTFMGQMARDILNHEKEITRTRLRGAQRNVQFNALSDRIEANISALKDIRDIELKRHAISKYGNTYEGRQRMRKQEEIIRKIKLALGSRNVDSRIAICNYLSSAVDSLRQAKDSLDKPTFKKILIARSYVYSYAGIIDSLRKLVMDAEKDESTPNYFDDIDLGDGGLVSLRELIKDISDISEDVKVKYLDVTKKMLTDYFKEFYGDGFEFKTGVLKDKTLTVADWIEGTPMGDISFSDMFFDSMAASSDVYIQLMAAVISKANNNIRQATINDSNRIFRLMKMAEEVGITSFEWMFELDENGKKTGNYIQFFDYNKFENEKERFLNYIENKYGRVSQGEEARKRKEEVDRWFAENTDPSNPNEPRNIPKYHSEAYKKLSDDQKIILDEYLKIKKECDDVYPPSRTDLKKAIQIRKTAGNRILSVLSNPTKLFSVLKSATREAFMVTEDDNQTFGEKSRLMNFDRSEHMVLPILYNNRLKDPEDLSTDVFSALMLYKHAANTFEQMEKIVDPLETARFWATEGRNKSIVENETELQERLHIAGQEITKKLLDTNTRIEAKIKTLMETQVYQRYLKDEGTLFDGKVSVTKAGNFFLNLTSVAALGFNFLAQTANALTGLAMGNIEAAAGEYFSANDLRLADGAYFSHLPAFLAELSSPVKTNWISLFDQLFDIKQNYGNKLRHNKKKNFLEKIFGSTIQYLGQDAGDHWLYNRIAIAICKGMKVRVPKEKPKTVKPIRSYADAINIVKKIQEDSEEFQLENGDKYYVNRALANLWSRVTSIINGGSEDSFRDTHEDGRPNNWKTPSTNIGTGIDGLVRDFFDNMLFCDNGGNWHHDNMGDDLTAVYPNMTESQIKNFLAELVNLKRYFDTNGMTVVSKDIVASGTISIKDGRRNRKLRVAGTLDLLVHDNQGNFYIYDMKTHRGKTISEYKKKKWAKQLSLYKILLEQKYGIKVKGLNILPIKVSYPTPEGEFDRDGNGHAKYEVREGNQLLCDGAEFKGASPRLGGTIQLDFVNQKFDLSEFEEIPDTIEDESDDDMEEMSLHEALRIRNVYADRDDIKEMYIPEGTVDENGEAVTVQRVTDLIRDVNQDLYGIYNDEDMSAANRILLGRALLQMRKWVKPSFNRRFQKAQVDLRTGRIKEGYYRTLGRVLIKEVGQGKVSLFALKDKLTPEEYANCKRALFELFQFYCAWALVSFTAWPDKKSRPWLLKFIEYCAQREVHELGMLAPSPIMLTEILKTAKTPAVSLNTADNLITAINSTINPFDYMDEIKSGPYKGYSSFEKNWAKAPIPIISQYRQIERFTGSLDEAIAYFTKGR